MEICNENFSLENLFTHLPIDGISNYLFKMIFQSVHQIQIEFIFSIKHRKGASILHVFRPASSFR